MYKYVNIKNINKQIVRDLNKFMLDNESRYRGQLFTVVNRVLAKNRSVDMLLLSGESCAGKTTTAKILKNIFESKGRNVDVINMDDFFITLADREKLPNGELDYDSPNILNYDLMDECFTKFFKGEKVYFPVYDFPNSKSIPNAKLYKRKHNSIIIFEGIHVFNPRVLEHLGTNKYFKVFISPMESFKIDDNILTTKNLRLLRRTVRDVQRRGTKPKETLDIWQGVLQVEDQYIAPYKSKVDYYINTTHEYELGIYKTEVDKLIADGKVTKEEMPFMEFLDKVEPISKSILPDTSLMWEFVTKED